MYPPIFSISSSSAAVKAILGSDPVRVYPFGNAPEDVALPYAVWQTIAGLPENYITNTPDVDGFLLQVDVYGETVSSARNGAEVLRDALEPYAHIVSWRGDGRDKTTMHYKYSFDINFITAR